METPYFSVCVPTYNRERLIAETLDSILGQTFGDFELVVVDDGSTDNTRRVVEEYAARDSRVRYVPLEKNLGMVGATNRCLEEARGKIIYTFDSDDVMHPESLELRREFFETHPEVAILYSDMELMDFEGRLTSPSYWAAEGYRPCRGRLSPAMLSVVGLFASNGTTCIRREVYEALGPQSGDLPHCNDGYYFLRGCGRFQADYIPRPLARVRLHEGNASRKPRGSRLYHRVEAIRRLVKEYPDCCPAWKARFYMANHACRAGLADVEFGDLASARTFFGRAWRFFPLHAPAAAWYLNTFLNIRPLWNFNRFKALYLAMTGGRRDSKE